MALIDAEPGVYNAAIHAHGSLLRILLFDDAYEQRDDSEQKLMHFLDQMPKKGKGYYTAARRWRCRRTVCIWDRRSRPCDVSTDDKRAHIQRAREPAGW